MSDNMRGFYTYLNWGARSNGSRPSLGMLHVFYPNGLNAFSIDSTLRNIEKLADDTKRPVCLAYMARKADTSTIDVLKTPVFHIYIPDGFNTLSKKWSNPFWVWSFELLNKEEARTAVSLSSGSDSDPCIAFTECAVGVHEDTAAEELRKLCQKTGLDICVPWDRDTITWQNTLGSPSANCPVIRKTNEQLLSRHLFI